MLAFGSKGEYTREAGEGGRGILQSIEEPSEASTRESSEEELWLCFDGELQNQFF